MYREVNLLLVDKPKVTVNEPVEEPPKEDPKPTNTTTVEELPTDDEQVIDDTNKDKDLIDGDDLSHPDAVVPSGHQNTTTAIAPTPEPDVPEKSSNTGKVIGVLAIILASLGFTLWMAMKCRKKCLRRTDLSDQFSDPTEHVQSQRSLRSNLFSE